MNRVFIKEDSIKEAVKSVIIDLLITAVLLISATALGCLFSYFDIQETNVVITYILSVLLVSRFTKGYVYGIIATICSLILFNWFFTAPYFTLDVYDPTYTITFLIMSITSVITSALTTRVKEEALKSQKKEAESNALYKLTNMLTDAEDVASIASITVKTVSDILGCDSAMICCTETGEPESSFVQQKGNTQIRRELHNGKEIQKRIENLHTPYDVDDEYFNYPIYGRTTVLGILRVPKDNAKNLNESQIRIVYAIIESTALALERLCSLKAQAKIHEEATQEHYRGNLLRSISHDIRTPLSGIMGSVEMLMDMTDKDDPRYEIEAGVYQDADWLHSLVENILNLTKLHDGHLNIAKQPEAAEEVIAAAIMVMEKRCPERNITVSMPDDLVMVPMDAKLISQVLVNLLDNAAKHTPADKEINVSVRLLENNVEFAVRDRGNGIAESDIDNVFQMFYTTRRKSADSQRGIGLGLAICESIVEAHGGTISVRNRKNGGAEFKFTLPLGGEEDQ